MAFPVLTAAGVMLYADRHFGGHIFDANHGGVPVLWQHLFWFFGHPEVYILVLPYFGVVTEVFAVFSRKPVFGYKVFVAATVAIGVLSIGVWAHHMYATGVVLLPFFGFLTMLIAVPTGVKFFNWIGTMWGGEPHASTVRCCSRSGSSSTFVIGGVTGVMLASAVDRLPPHRLVLRRRPLPLRAVRRLGVRPLRRHLLLVPEVHRPPAARGLGEDPVLADVRRVQPDVLRAARSSA